MPLSGIEEKKITTTNHSNIKKINTQNKTSKNEETKKIAATFTNKTIVDPSDFINQEILIPVSLPHELKCGSNIAVPNKYFLSAYLNLLQGIQNELGQNNKLGKVRIIIVGKLTACDFFLKFKKNINTILENIAKDYHPDINMFENNNEKYLANLFMITLKTNALEKEKQYIEKYKKQIQQIKERTSGFSLDCSVEGWSDIEDHKDYQKQSIVIKEKFEDPTDIFKKVLYLAAIKHINNKGGHKEKDKKDASQKMIAQLSLDDIFKKLSPPKKDSELEKIISIYKKHFPTLKVDWVLFFVECSVNYLSKEAPFFLMQKGKLLYGSALIEDIFQILLDMNRDLHFLQVKCEPKAVKIEGLSQSYTIQNGKVTSEYQLETQGLQELGGTSPKLTSPLDKKSNDVVVATPVIARKELPQANSPLQRFSMFGLNVPGFDAKPEPMRFIRGRDVKNIYLFRKPFEGKIIKEPEMNKADQIAFFQYILDLYSYFFHSLPSSIERDEFMLQNENLTKFFHENTNLNPRARSLSL